MDISILTFIFIVVFSSLSLRIIEEYYYEECMYSILNYYHAYDNTSQKRDIEMGLD
jgi:hypothetical protein